jgi:hypothetical protein
MRRNKTGKCQRNQESKQAGVPSVAALVALAFSCANHGCGRWFFGSKEASMAVTKLHRRAK